MRRATLAIALAASSPATALAADVAPATPSATSAVKPPPAPSGVGLGVLALPGGSAAAWPLAQDVYADPTLRPARVDEAQARVLCGEPPPAAADAESDLHNLAETVAAIHGDDAPSRTLLGELVHRFGLRGIVVVRPGAPSNPASARVFLGDTGAFDAAAYTPDEPSADGGPPTGAGWSAVVHSLARAYGQVSAPALATHDAPPAGEASPRHFYESAWFWGAVGLAALTGGAVFFLTRDSGSPTIHLDAQVPH